LTNILKKTHALTHRIRNSEYRLSPVLSKIFYHDVFGTENGHGTRIVVGGRVDITTEIERKREREGEREIGWQYYFVTTHHALQ
jgi:hypothetical protein